MKSLRALPAVVALSLIACTASALEPRTWIVLDGRTIEAALQSVSGNLVSLLDNSGRRVQLDKSFLSIGDNDYITENFPDQKKGFITAPAVQLPIPAKVAKIDPKLFTPMTETFPLAVCTFAVIQTPHFKIMYQKPVNPKDVCELAERMWFDAAYVHATFPQKFVNGRRMAIFLAADDSSYEQIGGWYADLLRQAGQQENAARVHASWKQSASSTLYLPRELSDKYSVNEMCRVFRAYKQGASAGGGGKPELIRGVWTPFFVHCLAADMIGLQIPGTSGFGAAGFYAISKGHAYFKEVTLTGKSETSLLRSQSSSGQDVSSTRGLDDVRHWASELKKWVRKGEVTPTFATVNGLAADTVDVKGNVLAYGWARYLQSSIPKLSAFNRLIQRIATSHQVPEPDDFAKFYGFASHVEMETDFGKWLQSPEFR